MLKRTDIRKLEKSKTSTFCQWKKGVNFLKIKLNRVKKKSFWFALDSNLSAKNVNILNEQKSYRNW